MTEREQTGYNIKGINCGRNKDGTFYCKCGKCERLSQEDYEKEQHRFWHRKFCVAMSVIGGIFGALCAALLLR